MSDTTTPLHNKITIVDEYDYVIGSEYLFPALEQGLIRRCSRVFVFNHAGEILLQQRSEHVRFPLMFDHSASGHVDEGDTYESTAYREMQEEIGLTNQQCSLHVLLPAQYYTELGTTKLFAETYYTTIDTDTPFTTSVNEVASLRWLTLEELTRNIQAHPDQFTFALRETVELNKHEIAEAIKSIVG